MSSLRAERIFIRAVPNRAGTLVTPAVIAAETEVITGKTDEVAETDTETNMDDFRD